MHTSISKEEIEELAGAFKETLSHEKIQYLIMELEEEMHLKAEILEFEEAARIRDKIFELKKLLKRKEKK